MDYSIRLMGFKKNKNGDGHMVTGMDLFKFFWCFIQTAFIYGPATTCVAIHDDHNNTPLIKRAEQARRAKSRAKGEESKVEEDKIKPYDYGVEWEFHVGGIKRKDSIYIDMIDTRRLDRSSHIKSALWYFFVEQIDTSLIPPGKLLILDYHQSGPVLMSQNTAPTHYPMLYHNLGETDLAIVFWCWVFYQYEIQVISRDTDNIFLLLNYLIEMDSKYHPMCLFWTFENDAHYDMKKAYHSLFKNSESKLHPTVFRLRLILADTDFYEKSLVSGWIGTSCIFNSVDKIASHFENTPHSGFKLNEMGDAFFREFICWQYTLVLKPKLDSKKNKGNSKKKPLIQTETLNKPYTVDEITTHIADLKLKRYNTPKEEAIQQAKKLLDANWVYWVDSWKEYTKGEPPQLL